MREILAAERQVGVAQEFLVLVAVRIESCGDEGARSDDCADATGKFGFGTGNAARGHGAVDAEIDAVERSLGGELCDHAADVGLVGVLRHPAGADPVFGQSGNSMPTSSTPSNSRATCTKPPM